jgi:hypothetical protein
VTRRRSGFTLVAIAAVAALAGCGSSVSPLAPAATASLTDAASVGRSSGASASAPPSRAATPPLLTIDPALLELLPAAVGRFDRQTDADVDAEAFADPALARFATAGATALYADPATGDFAFATVLRLRGAGIDAPTFRGYRDSFDAGACSQAGGVSGHAEAEIAGRTTYIGSCAGGVFTYHTLLPASHALLSISSAGAKRFGEQLAAAVPG